MPPQELETIELNGSHELIVDGDMILMYSATLEVELKPLVRGLRNLYCCGSASEAGPCPFLPQVIGRKQLSQIDWGFHSAPISTTLAAFGTIFEYVSTSS